MAENILFTFVVDSVLVPRNDLGRIIIAVIIAPYPTVSKFLVGVRSVVVLIRKSKHVNIPPPPRI
jgi:hypothetical protein